MKPLSARQQEILSFINSHIAEMGFPPTRLEIAENFKFRSINAVQDHLVAIARKGWIELAPGKSRGIQIVERPTPQRKGRAVTNKEGTMLFTKTIEAEIEVDLNDVFKKIETEGLVDELNARGFDFYLYCEEHIDLFADDEIDPAEWRCLYELLYAGKNDSAIEEIKRIVQEKTGRIIP